MPKANLKKIKSALSSSRFVVSALAAAIILAPVALLAIIYSGQRFNTTPMIVGDISYKLEIVSSAVDQAKGLGGRAGLAANRGMLFAYDNADERCFWMKDMRFAIDIIWFDSDKTVTHIEPHLMPSTYPREYCASAQYVVELQAGQTAKSGLRIGQAARF